MHSDSSTSVSKKRKRSSSSDDGHECEPTSSIIRRSIAQLTAVPEIPPASLHSLLNTLNDAYGSALTLEARDLKLPFALKSKEDKWNWELSAEQITRLSEEELAIWKHLLPCRHQLHSGIKLHPINWKMPVVDLRQWRVHISGREGTPWEGGVYSMDVIFWPGSLERIPRFRFVPPLFHPNVFPSGTWGYFFLPDVVTVVDRFEARWTKTPAEDPYQFAKLLSSIENVLHEPVISNPSQSDAYSVAKNDPEEYEKRVRAQAVLWKPHP